MKKIIELNYYSQSKKWNRRIPKIKINTQKILYKMSNYFKKNHLFNLNLIFSDKTKMTKLNQKYRDKYQDTDVLTFVSRISNKELGKILYCDIFFSIDTIEDFIKKKQYNFI